MFNSCILLENQCLATQGEQIASTQAGKKVENLIECSEKETSLHSHSLPARLWMDGLILGIIDASKEFHQPIVRQA